MNISFSFEHLYPADGRAGRHIETLVRRFRGRGHNVFVVTTPTDHPLEPEGVEVLRLREAPGAKGRARSDTLMGKAITRFLKQHEVDVHFAEGLTPLSALAVKAAHRAGCKTLIRVLADASGIVHTIGGERRLTPSALKKRVSTMLGYADAAAASSERCSALLREYYEGEIRVIEKCVDLNVCNPDRVQELDRDTFREKFELGDRPAIIYAREQLRADTVLGTLPVMSALHELDPALILVVAGEIDDFARTREGVEGAGLSECIRLCGALTQRDLFAAYSIAGIYLAPPESGASESELLEAMAMRCALACYRAKAEAAPELIAESGALVLSDGPEAAAREILGVLQDGDALAERQARAQQVAGAMDIGVGVDKVQHLCEELLGLPLTDFDALAGEQEPPHRDEEAPEEATDEASEEVAAESEDEAGDEMETSDDDAREPESAEAGADTGSDDEGDDGRGEEVGDDERSELSDDDDDRPRRRRRRRRRGRRLKHEDEEDGGGAGPEADREARDQESGDETPVAEESVVEASQRLRDLDPKLTLRDLMPYLRPPKLVFVMSMASATGQHRAGEAIFEAFKSIDQNLKVRQVNIADYLSRRFSASEIDQILMDMGQSLYEIPLEASTEAAEEGENGNTSPGPTELFDKAFGPKMTSLILDKRPQQVVLTHYLPIRLLTRLKEEHELRMKICVVVTDYDFHPHWIAEGVDQYLVPTDKVRFKMLRAGVSPNQIDVVGIPVHPRFEGEVDRDRVRRDLNIKPGQPTILLRPGGIGTTEEIKETLEQIMRVGFPFNLLVLTGKNEALMKAIKDMTPPRGVTVRSFGFVNNIHELMGVADLMITRAVGHTVAEAFASGLPMLLLRPAEGVEEHTADWFVERGVARKAHDAVDLEWLMTDVLRNQGRGLHRMRETAANGGRPRSGAAGLSVERIRRQLH